VNTIFALIGGLIVGAALTMSLTVQVMRTRMVTARRSRRSFEDTCAAIEKVVAAAPGWGFPIDTWHFYKTFEQKELVPEGFRKLEVYFVCNSALASKMIAHAPPFVGLMPCSWAVYELADGSVWLAKMNVGLMSRMFSGLVGASMRRVGEADEKFLAEVLGEG